MLFFLIALLQKIGSFSLPAAFTYFSTRMLLSAITSLLLTIWLGPIFIRKLYLLKIGQPIRSKEECPLLAKLHEKKKDTPTMGGILILFSMTISLLLWMDLSNCFTWILLITTLFLGFLGAWDDFLKLSKRNSKGLSSKKKFGFQLFFALILSFYLLFIPSERATEKKSAFKAPFAKESVVSKPLTKNQYMTRIYLPFKKGPLFTLDGAYRFLLLLFFLFVITGASNAVNLTDGLDGLAAGCIVMVSMVLALFAFLSNHIQLASYLNILYIEGSGEIAVYLCAISGALLGFLWYNGYPAQVFMGDTGSLALGGILGVSSILLRREFLLAIAGAVFVLEAGSVILQVLSYRYRNKKRIFLCAPLHHHFEYKGWPETKVVLRFWIISLIFAMIAVASIKFQ